MTAKQLLAVSVASGLLPMLQAEAQVARANPIRRVVTMLQTMQEKVTAEGEQEEALFKKFMCYCTTNKGDLEGTIAAAEAKGPELGSAIEEAQAEKAQLDEDLKGHKADRATAKESLVEANALRKKQADEYAASNSELTSNSAAIKRAVTALEKGMGGGFLQTSAAQVLKKLVASRDDDADRQSVLAFLSGTEGYSPQSGQITGILKQIGDEMSKSTAEETAAEEESKQQHAALSAAKSKEIAAHTKAIETKSVRVGEVAVSIANMKNDLADTQGSLEEDKKFLAELEQGCGTKQAEWDERQKTRSEELVALAETIKILNADDALELFKKSLPTPEAASFVQLSTSAAQVRARALAEVRTAQRVAAQRAPGLDLIALALHGSAAGFEKVTAMIDEMVGVLKSEQDDDDQKKAYCGSELDKADDNKKSLEQTAADENTAASNAQEGIATLNEELKALATGIEQLDKSVAQATEQRKQEHTENTELIALNTQAKDLLGVAKNRLNKFYNPKLYIAPPKKELTREERVYQNSGLAAATTAAPVAFVQGRPAPPPETFEGAYGKKEEETSGVIAMVDMLIKDLDKEMTVAQTSEKEAQKDYVALMADAKEKRSADSKATSQKEGAKADLEGELQTHKDNMAAAAKDLSANAEVIHGLHSECDWLVEHFEARKNARASEVDSLNNAKAVLAGADYSLVQLHEKHHLRGGA